MSDIFSEFSICSNWTDVLHMNSYIQIILQFSINKNRCMENLPKGVTFYWPVVMWCAGYLNHHRQKSHQWRLAQLNLVAVSGSLLRQCVPLSSWKIQLWCAWNNVNITSTNPPQNKLKRAELSLLMWNWALLPPRIECSWSNQHFIAWTV